MGNARVDIGTVSGRHGLKKDQRHVPIGLDLPAREVSYLYGFGGGAPWILEPSATELYVNRICTSLPRSLRIA